MKFCGLLQKESFSKALLSEFLFNLYPHTLKMYIGYFLTFEIVV